MAGIGHAEHLLVYLPVHPDTRRELASLLFSSADPAHASTYLRQVLQRLRQARPHLSLTVDSAELLQAREENPASCQGAVLADEREDSAPSEWWNGDNVDELDFSIQLSGCRL